MSKKRKARPAEWSEELIERIGSLPDWYYDPFGLDLRPVKEILREIVERIEELEGGR